MARHVGSSYGNHHRAGTEADQRGRGGMDHAYSCFFAAWHFTARRCGLRPGGVSYGLLRIGMSHNHARVGTGLDQRQRRGMDQGEFGRTRQGLHRQCKALLVGARQLFLNHHAVGAVPASTPDGGMGSVRLVTAWQITFVARLGWALTTIVDGTTAASRPRGGMRQGMTRRVEFVHGTARRVLDREVRSGR